MLKRVVAGPYEVEFDTKVNLEISAAAKESEYPRCTCTYCINFDRIIRRIDDYNYLKPFRDFVTEFGIDISVPEEVFTFLYLNERQFKKAIGKYIKYHGFYAFSGNLLQKPFDHWETKALVYFRHDNKEKDEERLLGPTGILPQNAFCFFFSVKEWSYYLSEEIVERGLIGLHFTIWTPLLKPE